MSITAHKSEPMAPRNSGSTPQFNAKPRWCVAVFSLLLLICTGPATVAAEFQPLWQQGFTNTTWLRFILTASLADDNDLIIGGSVAEPANRALVARISAAGEIVWQHRTGEGAFEGVEGMVTDAEHNVYFGAKVSWEPQRTVALIKLDTLGAEVWRATEERFIPASQTVSGVVINAAGDLFWIVAREQDSPGLGHLIVISKFHPNGTRYWRTIFPKPVFVNFDGVERLLCPLPNGGIALVGSTPVAERLGQGMAAQLASDGSVSWITEVAYPSFFTRVNVHSSGTLCASSEFGPYAVFDAGGNLVRAGRSSDQGEVFAVRPDGFLLVQRSGSQQFFVDPNGNFQWRTLDNHSAELGPLLLPDGGWLAAGAPSDDPDGIRPIVFARYDPNGNELWSERIPASRYSIFAQRPSSSILFAADGTIRLVLNLRGPFGIGIAAFRYTDPSSSITIAAPPKSAHWDGVNAVEFNVAATAEAPLTYQWLGGFGSIPGATNLTVALSPAQILEHRPWLRVRITNGKEAVTTRVADVWLDRILLRIRSSRLEVHADPGVPFAVETSHDLTTWRMFDTSLPETLFEMSEPKAFFRAVQRP